VERGWPGKNRNFEKTALGELLGGKESLMMRTIPRSILFRQIEGEGGGNKRLNNACSIFNGPQSKQRFTRKEVKKSICGVMHDSKPDKGQKVERTRNRGKLLFERNHLG